MKKPVYFYVIIKKSSLDTYWYSEFINEVFLVKNDPRNKKQYQVANIPAWIDKVDAKRLKVSFDAGRRGLRVNTTRLPH